MKKLLPLLVAVGPLLLLAAFARTQDAGTAPLLKAGVAQVVITPPVNMWMAGYAGRKKPAEGKVQDLFAKALALEDSGGNRLVIVTTDLIGILPTLRASMEQKVAGAFQLPPQALLLNASHTHSGPEYRVRTGPHDQEAKEYTDFLEIQLVRVIGAALED